MTAAASHIPLGRPGQGADKARMDEILRVDHAGEYAAVLIYRAQKAEIGRASCRARG